tara:strand:+ start:178 stop:561 length:384 start_codon:yes stop_codon:yes gene_type:complete
MTYNIKASDLFSYNNMDCPEQRLFIAVLSQALHDAFSSHVPGLEKRQAQLWLTNKSEDFKIICENAGKNPDYVIQKVRLKILKDNGWNVDISMRTKPPRIRKYKQKHLTGNAYYAAKREQRATSNTI